MYDNEEEDDMELMESDLYGLHGSQDENTKSLVSGFGKGVVGKRL
jgi:hypothetical protein